MALSEKAKELLNRAEKAKECLTAQKAPSSSDLAELENLEILRNW